MLPLYIVLMGLFPPVLWMMLRQPDWTMLASIALWLVSRQIGWNLSAYPAGTWYFNPFAWQVLFVFGSWCALGGAASERAGSSIIPITLYLCIAYLVLALVMTMAGKFPDFGALFPHWLYSTFNPNDKTNLAPYRFLHFVVIVIMVIRFVPKEWPGLEWKMFDPLVVCGQQSLAVFCVGVFLSFVGHFELIDELGLAARADLRQRDRHRDHDASSPTTFPGRNGRTSRCPSRWRRQSRLTQGSPDPGDFGSGRSAPAARLVSPAVADADHVRDVGVDIDQRPDHLVHARSSTPACRAGPDGRSPWSGSRSRHRAAFRRSARP